MIQTVADLYTKLFTKENVVLTWKEFNMVIRMLEPSINVYQINWMDKTIHLKAINIVVSFETPKSFVRKRYINYTYLFSQNHIGMV